ncbi:MAG TPA: hypothetical protein PKY30_26205 [Myxococcota bacterium]|nr:hypothetical protein [Myxococcota bacterium]HNH50553.1 hypothetical protein [Myxococcota bacterium]
MSTLFLLLACTHAVPPSPPPTTPTGPSRHALRVSAPGIDPNYAGTWGGDSSTAVYRIGIEGDQLWLDAWDSGDGEWFSLDRLVYDRDVTVETTMPSTNWTLQNRFVLEGPGKMTQKISGAASGEFELRRVSVEPTRE